MLFPYSLTIMIPSLVKHFIKILHITKKFTLVICAEWCVVNLIYCPCPRWTIVDLGESWPRDQLTWHTEGGKGGEAIIVRRFSGHTHVPSKTQFSLLLLLIQLIILIAGPDNQQQPVLTIHAWLQATEAVDSSEATASTQTAVSLDLFITQHWRVPLYAQTPQLCLFHLC